MGPKNLILQYQILLTIIYIDLLCMLLDIYIEQHTYKR